MPPDDDARLPSPSPRLEKLYKDWVERPPARRFPRPLHPRTSSAVRAAAASLHTSADAVARFYASLPMRQSQRQAPETPAHNSQYNEDRSK